MKRSCMGHTKLKKLARKLSIPTYAAVGILECLWHLTAREAYRGDIGRLSDEDICVALDWPEEEPKLINALVECRWLDRSDEFRLVVHDWHEHADDATKKAIARNDTTFATEIQLSGEKSGNIATTPEVSRLPEPEPVPEPEPFIVVVPRADQAAWDEFCALYPKRSGALNKSKAEPKFSRLARDHPEIIAGVRRYRAWCDATGKTGTEFVKQMDSWLNGRLWLEAYEIPNGMISMVNERDRILEQLHGT